MTPGTWADITSQVGGSAAIGALLQTVPGSHINEYADKGVWYPTTRQVFFVGASHAHAGPGTAEKLIGFSDDASSWGIAGPDVSTPTYQAHSYQHNAIDVTNGDLYYRPYNTRELHRFRGGVWSPMASIPMGTQQVAGALEGFPERQGLVFVDGDWGVWTYSFAANTWTQAAHTNGGSGGGLPKFPMGPYHNVAVYSAVHRIVLFGGGNGSATLYRMTQDGALSVETTAPVPVAVNSTIFTVDPASGDYLLFDNSERFWKYAPATRVWTPMPSNQYPPFFTVAADGPALGTVAFPVPTYGVVMFTTWAHANSRVFVYKHSAAVAAQPALRVDDATVTEGDTGTVAAAFTARLSTASGQVVTVSYATANQTATAGVDYQTASGTLTIAAGATTGTIAVSVVGDTAIEPDETFVVNLSGAVGATVADGQALGTISDDDAPSLSRLELSHGSRHVQDLAAATGPAGGEDAYRLAQHPRSSYEVAVDGVSGDVTPLVLQRLAADNLTVLQSATATGAGSSVRLRFENASEAPVVNQTIRVLSGGCTSACGTGDAYRIRAWESTCAVPRFNNGGSQVAVLVLQNRESVAVDGHVDFWNPAGALLASHPVALGPRQTLVLDTASLSGLAGQSGSITVSHNGGYSALAGKAVAVEPATGFSFDAPLTSKAR